MWRRREGVLGVGCQAGGGQVFGRPLQSWLSILKDGNSLSFEEQFNNSKVN